MSIATKMTASPVGLQGGVGHGIIIYTAITKCKKEVRCYSLLRRA